MATDYASFIESKSQHGNALGFEPVWMPDFLKDFQRHLTEWQVRRGRGATFAGCGLGKTPMQLVFAENVVRHTNSRALILTHLAVAPQFVTEGRKFGVEVTHSRDGSLKGAGVYVTNYERLKFFKPDDFSCVLCDESGGIKDFESKRKEDVTEFMRTVRYRGLYTAVAAPNDFDELGTSSEALGEMGHRDMISKFFKKDTTKDHLGWGRTKNKLRTYAERDFWRWVCSWARACRRPSDLGFDDANYVLPPLECVEHVVSPRRGPADRLFDTGARSLQEQREEQRRTLEDRCERVAELVNGTGQPAVCWAHLNDEADLMERLIPDAIQVSGSDSDEAKEEKLAAFASGEARVLVTKSVIAGFGLNWQHCAHQTHFPSHSYEQWEQCIGRSRRFGQSKTVRADLVTTPGAAGVVANMQRKQEQAELMFARLVELMNDGLRLDRGEYGTTKEEVPAWLSSISA